jgi:hypothetical protein
MFTFGIFSTHIPYIAFVFFYALFFLSGFQKIAEEDPSAEVKFTQNKLTIIIDNQIIDNGASSDLDDFHISNVLKKGRMFYVNRMKKLCTPPNKQIQSEIFGFSNFSRPPPAA